MFLAVLALSSGVAAGSPTPVTGAGTGPVAAEHCAPVDAATVSGFFDQWNLALASLDADTVTARYWPDAVLLASASGAPRASATLIHDYFVQFLAQRPRGHIDSRSIQVGCNLAIDAGSYTFSMMGANGEVSETPALYTFVYQYRNGAWKILHHHFSMLAEPGAAPLTVVSPMLSAPHKPKTLHSPAATGTAAAAPPTAAANTPAAATSSPAAPGGPAPDNKDSRAEASPSAPAAPKPKARKLANVVVARETRPEDKESPRSSWSPMFLNQAGTPEVDDFYPKEAREQGAHGVIGLRVCSDPHGRLAGAPEVLKTSGNADLDAAAREWAKAARWIPATENGSAVEGCTRLSIKFGHTS